MAVAASPAPQLYENGFSPLLARYANGPEAPASTAHASHVAAYTPITTYIAPTPYIAAYPAVSSSSSLIYNFERKSCFRVEFLKAPD